MRCAKRLVLRILVGEIIRTLKLDANREIVAGGSSFVSRLPRVPGARVKWHVLNDLTIAPDERVRRDARSAMSRK